MKGCSRQWTLLTVIVVSSLGWGRGARADLFAFTTSADPRAFGSGSIVAQYSDAGRFVRTLPPEEPYLSESVAGLEANPDGWVYFTRNILGQGTLTGVLSSNPAARRGRGTAEFNTPGGLTVGPDGMVYTASNKFQPTGVTGVLRFNPADNSLTPVVRARPPTEQFQALARSVAVARNGDIYLSRDGVGVERYAAGTGTFISLVIPSAPAIFDMEFGPDDNLYLPGGGGIDRYDRNTGALIDHFIPAGRGGLASASDLSFGNDGMLYVNDRTGKAVLRYDAVTGDFRGVFIDPEQYTTGHLHDLRTISYVVPEPGALALVAGAVAPLALRRRRRT